MLYSEGGQGTAEITGKTLLQSCLRMKPDRVLLAELRSKVAYDYIVNISSGHPGSITTVHAGSAAGAFEMLMLRVKESDEGQTLDRDVIHGLLKSEVDVVIQVHQLKRPGSDGAMRKVRRVTEIYYDPAGKRKHLG
jgi:type IV secretion system protein VirB11